MAAFRVTDAVAYQSSGVPLLIVGLMYPRRTQIQELMRDKKRREDMDTVSSVQSDGSSIANLTNELLWLLPRFESFEPDRWWWGTFSLAMRLCQSSLLVIFYNQTIQTVYACIIGQVAVCAQRNVNPYRRDSDNSVALMVQWLVFVWCAVFLARVITAAAWLPAVAVGMLCALPTLAVLVRSLQLAFGDMQTELVFDDDYDIHHHSERRKTYKKGDFILHDDSGARYSIPASEFSMSYELSPEPATDDILAQDGFQRCRLIGRVWARQLSNDDVAEHFSTGEMITSWGSMTGVQAGCFLVMPFPHAGELLVIEQDTFLANFSHVARLANSHQQNHDHDERALSHANVLARWQTTLQVHGGLYCKRAKVHAKLLSRQDATTDKDSVEGMFSVLFQSERFALDPLSFAVRFDRARPEPTEDAALEKEGYQVYAQLGKVWACKLTNEDVLNFPSKCFVGKFGGTMQVEAGDWLAMASPSADEVFVVPQSHFATTYQLYNPQERVVSQMEALARWKGVLQESHVYARATDGYAKRATCDGVITDEDHSTTPSPTDDGSSVVLTSDMDRDDVPPQASAPTSPWDITLLRGLCVAEPEQSMTKRPPSDAATRHTNISRGDGLEAMLLTKDDELSRKDEQILHHEQIIAKKKEEVAHHRRIVQERQQIHEELEEDSTAEGGGGGEPV